jgi:HlyD family secretion protein
LSLRESELSYESSREQLEEYSIKAPISGTVVEKSVKAGDTVENSNSGSTALCVIADMSVMTFRINVDELDIAQLERGQEVSITADALDDRSFSGYVDNIGILGSSQDGVTAYPVTIVINDAEDLWPGMNVSAKIIVNSAQDVLRVPVTAVSRGNVVLVKDAENAERSNGAANAERPESENRTRPEGAWNAENASGAGVTATMGGIRPEGAWNAENASGAGVTATAGGIRPGGAGSTSGAGLAVGIRPENAPEGAAYVRVEIGLNDESYIEIKSGLSEGDILLIPVVQSSGESSSAPTQMVTGGAGGMGGPPTGTREFRMVAP